MAAKADGERFPVMACDEVAWCLRGVLDRSVGAAAIFASDEPDVLMVLSGTATAPRNTIEQRPVHGSTVEIVMRSSLEDGTTVASVAMNGDGLRFDREYSLGKNIPSLDGLTDETAQQDALVHEALGLLEIDAEATFELAARLLHGQAEG